MNVFLWVVAGVLAAVFLLTGLPKLLRPQEKLVETTPFLDDLTPGAVKLIGAVEVLGALGLILPAALDIAPVLTPLAAAGLAVTMLVAGAVHLRRQESRNVVVNLVLFALAALVAVLRFGPQSF